MAMCALGCGRELSAQAQFKICVTCRSAIQRNSHKRQSELKENRLQLTVRQRRLTEIIGAEGEGPRAGGYVAQLLVKRRARARADKQRANKPDSIKHFPSHADA